MPELNGLDLQDQLWCVSPETRVIVVTGRPEPETQSAVLAAGALAFLSKPVADEAFLSSVRGALE
jgi:FixJ family two-component response regulator